MTHKEMVKLYRELEKAINRSLKSAKRLKKGEKIRAVKYNKNITGRSFEALVRRYKRLYPRGKIHEKYMTIPIVGTAPDSTRYILEMIYNRLQALEAYASGSLARGGSEAVRENIDWFYELLKRATEKVIATKEIIERLSKAFGVSKGGLVSEIEEIILAIYPKLITRTKRHDYSKYGDHEAAKELYRRVRAAFPEVKIREYPWTV